jgi:hypothetical protein
LTHVHPDFAAVLLSKLRMDVFSGSWRSFGLLAPGGCSEVIACRMHDVGEDWVCREQWTSESTPHSGDVHGYWSSSLCLPACGKEMCFWPRASSPNQHSSPLNTNPNWRAVSDTKHQSTWSLRASVTSASAEILLPHLSLALSNVGLPQRCACGCTRRVACVQNNVEPSNEYQNTSLGGVERI